MARSEAVRHAFNRGLISPLALARVDLKRSALSAAIQSNWMPRTLGSMMLRPGLQYIGNTRDDQPAMYVEFVRALNEMHLLEFTEDAMRVWTDDALLTRGAVSSAVSNGNFTTNLTGWTDNDDAGGTSAWVTGGYMGLTGNGTAAAIRDQEVTVIAADQNMEHALRIVVERGPVVLRVGSTLGDDDYINQATLGTGTHSLAFTPTGGSFFIRFLNRLKRIVLVDSCNVEAAGVVEVTSPYQEEDLGLIRADTDSLSVDVLFVGCVGYQQRRIERRASGRSWSVVLYQPEDGPFRAENVSTQTMTPSTISGNGTLGSSVAFFRPEHVGALFQLVSTGQEVTKNMTVVNDATNSILVTGITTDRNFTIVLENLTATGNTVVLQRSFDNAIWTDVPAYTWTADVTLGYTDGLDNQLVYYRLLCSVYAGGATDATLSIATGSVTGVVRVTGYTTNILVDIEIITDLGGSTATSTWSEGQWSELRGWPSAGTLYEGRLNWGGFDKVNMSISDAFDGFDPETEGDSGPINRSIGSGPMDTINWLLPLQRLILGAQLAEHSVRSNAFDEPITPSNFNRKQCSNEGSAAVQACRIGSRGVFVGRSGSRSYELSFDTESYDYHATDLTVLNPEVLQPMVVRMAIQLKPDVRIHYILSDGTVAVLVYDKAEQVQCWVKVETTGTVEDVVVLPAGAGTPEDRVYYQIAREINGTTVRFLEKWALEKECQGTYSAPDANLNKQADAFVVTGSGTRTITAAHLAGEEVVVWGNGKALGTYTLDSSGQATVSELLGSSGAVVGLGYDALFKSAKLGQTLAKHKNIDQIAPILYNTHAQGLLMGQDFDNMDPLPLMYEGYEVDPDRVYDEYDQESQAFPGSWSIDARVCLKASAPKPCTVLAVVIEGQVSG